MLNRDKVRDLLAKYKESERQNGLILKDDDVQKYFMLGENDKARDVIARKYPIGSYREVERSKRELLAEMVHTIPEYVNLKIEDIANNDVITDKIVALAEKV